jgi:hypothetical protein
MKSFESLFLPQDSSRIVGGAPLTSWSRSKISPYSKPGYTFGNLVYDPQAGLWRMYAHNVIDNKIYMSVSVNRRNFSTPVLVLDLGVGSWDDYSVGVPFTWYEAGAVRPWRMVYRGRKSSTAFWLGLATSLDGLTWERKDTAGVVLEDAVLKNGSSGWDSTPYGSIDFGSIIKVGETYYLYYDLITVTNRKIGLATSTDLVNWTRHANNPLYIGTVGPDVVGATVDDDQGRFCPDIVRWDTPDGVTRYVMFVPHYVGTHIKPEMEVYTCSSPIFLVSERVFVGLMFEIDTTPASDQCGASIYLGNDVPRIVVLDINRVVPNGIGHQIEMTNDVVTVEHGHAMELFVHDATLPGMVDGLTIGCKLSDVIFDFPVDNPLFSLAPLASDANVRALWLPGSTGSLCDFSGNGIDLVLNCDSVDGSGIKFISSQSGFVCRRPTLSTDPLISKLEADRTDFSLEFTVRFASHFTSGTRAIFDFAKSSAARHMLFYITGGVSNYTITFSCKIGGVSQTVNTITFPVASVVLNTPIRFAVCRDCSDGKLYIFKDGSLLNAGGTAYAGEIDDFSLENPPIGLYIGSILASSSFWDGYVDEIRISDICRYTANYVPSGFVVNYASSGNIFTSVYDAGYPGRGTLIILSPVIPANTSIVVLSRDADSALDQSFDIGDFGPELPTGRYHQYLISMATSDASVTPAFRGAIAQVF